MFLRRKGKVILEVYSQDVKYKCCGLEFRSEYRPRVLILDFLEMRFNNYITPESTFPTF